VVDKLAEIVRRRKAAHAKLRALKSKVYEAFLHLEEAAFSDGALPKRTKELIAVGISVKVDCESCMQWHIEQAAAAGATMREVLEAIEVGIEMGGGPATVSARFALEVLERIFAGGKVNTRPSGPQGRSRRRRTTRRT
jgi:AhpD family alkylhydroperoxidase